MDKKLLRILQKIILQSRKIKITVYGFRGSGFSPASGSRSGQFDPKKRLPVAESHTSPASGRQKGQSNLIKRNFRVSWDGAALEQIAVEKSIPQRFT